MTATQTETMDREIVAVLGAGGTMGFPIARNIGGPVRSAAPRLGANEHGRRGGHHALR